MTYRILDLFCGAGGAAMGYHRAGFEVVGVDIAPQPRYPFAFMRHDAMELLNDIAGYGPLHVLGDLDGWYPIDAIHASPPCQGYSAMSRCRPGLADKYPKLIEPVRELLIQTGLPYVIENVPGAPLKNPLQLCGTSFRCRAEHDGIFEIQRERWFETNWPATGSLCEHEWSSLPVYGHGAPGNRPDLRALPIARMTREAMGIDWMNRDEMNEAIPPKFTTYIGGQLARYLDALPL